MKQLTIAIDFDDTFTADMKLWSTFVNNCKGAGHRPIMVTARRETEENVDTINVWLDHWDCQMPIHFTAHGSKLEFMRRRGVDVDIWIDDNIEAAVYGH